MNDKIYEILMNLNRGRIAVDEAYDHIESAMCEANSNAVLAEVRAELKKFEGKPLSDYALGYRDALKKISEHFS